MSRTSDTLVIQQLSEELADALIRERSAGEYCEALRAVLNASLEALEKLTRKNHQQADLIRQFMDITKTGEGAWRPPVKMAPKTGGPLPSEMLTARDISWDAFSGR